MTQFMTRRERREAERAGLIPTSNPVVETATTSEVEVVEEVVVDVPVEPEVIEAPVVIQASEPEADSYQTQPTPQPLLSRRERRLLEEQGQTPTSTPVVPATTNPTPTVVIPDVEMPVLEPDHSIEEPVADFTGSNLLAEPSTQSIILDIAPEAIAIPLETGEISTSSSGSIEIIAEPITGANTAGLDGIELDQIDTMDAVTGVISIVEPISAIEVINQRASLGVVPEAVLKKGWWQPWALAGLGGVLVIVTIYAAITIISALGN
ncbi:hypothetical protein [Aquiluna sp. KACHI24]|uniref:hypothetical protein n=1 Tax=Aquiluna sp. KACHI24 TaxID=2968831 RepID=UPI00220F2ECD|nr:hypothetical protein [Aquiluna sp. KACHI24]BDQ00424.1 hypothetical protein AKACHI_07600 [Aquiluna sp. KACHI24]